MYTYVFAYYSAPSLQTAIFEGNQRDLEVATEELSEYLKRDHSVTRENLAEMKPKVCVFIQVVRVTIIVIFQVMLMLSQIQDKTRYCETRRKVLVDHVCEGYEQKLWVYVEDFVDE